jgi:hypothetical protein
VPLVDLGLNLIPLGQQRLVLGSQIGDDFVCTKANDG